MLKSPADSPTPPSACRWRPAGPVCCHPVGGGRWALGADREGAAGPGGGRWLRADGAGQRRQIRGPGGGGGDGTGHQRQPATVPTGEQRST